MGQEFAYGQYVVMRVSEKVVHGQISKHEENEDKTDWLYWVTTTDIPNKTYGPFTSAQIKQGY